MYAFWNIAHELKAEFILMLPLVRWWEVEDLNLCMAFMTQPDFQTQLLSSGFNMLASPI